jgi:hypothetical protein
MFIGQPAAKKLNFEVDSMGNLDVSCAEYLRCMAAKLPSILEDYNNGIPSVSSPASAFEAPFSAPSTPTQIDDGSPMEVDADGNTPINAPNPSEASSPAPSLAHNDMDYLRDFTDQDTNSHNKTPSDVPISDDEIALMEKEKRTLEESLRKVNAAMAAAKGKYRPVIEYYDKQ